MDNIKAMRLFLHAAQVGSMSGAGRRFGLSPASVSRQITALEDDLGVRLLNRTSRKLSLTEAGQVYLQRTERLLQDLEEMRDEVSSHVPRQRVGTPEDIVGAVAFLASRAGAFTSGAVVPVDGGISTLGPV